MVLCFCQKRSGSIVTILHIYRQIFILFLTAQKDSTRLRCSSYSSSAVVRIHEHLCRISLHDFHLQTAVSWPYLNCMFSSPFSMLFSVFQHISFGTIWFFVLMITKGFTRSSFASLKSSFMSKCRIMMDLVLEQKAILVAI